MSYESVSGRTFEVVAAQLFDRGYDAGVQAGRDEGTRLWLVLSVSLAVVYTVLGDEGVALARLLLNANDWIYRAQVQHPPVVEELF